MTSIQLGFQSLIVLYSYFYKERSLSIDNDMIGYVALKRTNRYAT
jgi:hypothetical protein